MPLWRGRPVANCNRAMHLVGKPGANRMPGVFLSYDRDDTDRTRPLAAALERAGHAVWWDLHVRGGAQFSTVIEEARNEHNHTGAILYSWQLKCHAHSRSLRLVQLRIGRAKNARDQLSCIPIKGAWACLL